MESRLGAAAVPSACTDRKLVWYRSEKAEEGADGREGGSALNTRGKAERIQGPWDVPGRVPQMTGGLLGKSQQGHQAVTQKDPRHQRLTADFCTHLNNSHTGLRISFSAIHWETDFIHLKATMT